MSWWGVFFNIRQQTCSGIALKMTLIMQACCPNYWSGSPRDWSLGNAGLSEQVGQGGQLEGHHVLYPVPVCYVRASEIAGFS